MPLSSKGLETKGSNTFLRPIDERDVLLAEIERVGQIGTWIQEDGQQMRWSRQLYHLLGLDPAHNPASAEAFFERVHPEDVDDVREMMHSESGELEYRLVLPNGTLCWVKGSQSIFHDNPRGITRRVGTVSDISQIKHAMLELETTLHKLKLSQQVSHTGSFECDPFSEEKTWSDELFRIYGMEPRPPLTWAEIMSMIHPEDRLAIQEWSAGLTEGKQRPLRYRIVRPDGEVRHVENHGAVFPSMEDGRLRIVGATIDVTEQARAQEQHQHQAKLQAIGTLAAGVAHELNNYLQLIGGNLALLQLQWPELVSEEIEQADHAVERASLLTRQLLAFARRQPFAPKMLDLCELLEATRPILRRLVGDHVNLVLETPHRPLFVRVDATHIEGALINLATNARDAMPEGGRLLFEVDRCRFYSHDPRPIAGMDPGSYVRLHVADEGEGIAPSVLSRIFEPYFTTKARGKGTGLGMAAVYGAVMQTGGFIKVHSVEGEGTHVDIYLPLAEAHRETTRAQHPNQPLPLQGRRVLVVEDIEGVRDVVCKLLRAQGHTVHASTHALEAIPIAEKQDLDLIITDLRMPEIDGFKLAELLRKNSPELDILFITGQISPEEETLVLERFGAQVLHKPFSLQSLNRALSNIFGPDHTR